MGRRLITILGVAIAVACGARLVTAQQAPTEAPAPAQASKSPSASSTASAPAPASPSSTARAPRSAPVRKPTAPSSAAGGAADTSALPEPPESLPATGEALPLPLPLPPPPSSAPPQLGAPDPEPSPDPVPATAGHDAPKGQRQRSGAQPKAGPQPPAEPLPTADAPAGNRTRPNTQDPTPAKDDPLLPDPTQVPSDPLAPTEPVPSAIPAFDGSSSRLPDPPGTLTTRSTDPLLDDHVERVEAPRPGQHQPGAAGAGAAGAAGGGAEVPYLLPAETLPLGKQAVGLTVDVQAPAVINLNQETRLKIVVRNGSNADALGVVVRDQLPEGLEFLDSQPPTQLAAGNVLTWKLGTMPASTEKVLVVRVKPRQVGSFDHAATVILMSGSKARTLVQEPKLKVEQTVKRSKVLSGDQVEFDIFISNPGTGPARDVIVQAQLSGGLKHQLGKRIEQPIALIKPGERKELEPLIVDAVSGGEQSCEVTATSPDVPQASDEAHAIQVVTVTEPMLDVKIKGPATRFTDTVATYTLVVENPGTAPAREVRVRASMPTGGSLIPDTADATYHREYSPARRAITWTIPQLEPKGSVTLSFAVRLGGIQLYQVAAEARANGPVPLYDKATCSTDVTGMADVVFQVTEPRRVLDEGEETTFEIRVRNQGSKDAARLLVRAQLSKNLVATGTGGTDENAQMSADGLVVFPVISRLPTKGDLTLSIRVKGSKPGIGTCQVSLVHDDLDDSALFRTAAVRITAAPDTTQR